MFPASKIWLSLVNHPRLISSIVSTELKNFGLLKEECGRTLNKHLNSVVSVAQMSSQVQFTTKELYKPKKTDMEKNKEEPI